MAEKPTEKTFAQFLEEQPAPAETVTLTGHAVRSAKAGSFAFTTGGQTLELPTDSVKRHRVMSEGPQRVVEIEIIVSKIDPKVVKLILADGIKHPNTDPNTYKEVTTDILMDKPAFKDAIVDPVSLIEPTAEAGFAADPAAGAQPFVLATPHHAPASTIAAQMGAPGAAQFITTPLRDPLTVYYFDHPHTLKEIAKDPIFDTYTLPENIFQNPVNTAAEGVGVQLGGQMVNPAIQAQAEMLRLGTTPVSDIVTVAYLDNARTTPWFDMPYTFKEVTKDPIADVWTVVENLPGGGGGTLAEGVAGGGPVVNPVWNLPGMMF